LIGIIRQARLLHDPLGAPFHRRSRLAYPTGWFSHGADLLGRPRRAFRKALDFFGHHRESASVDPPMLLYGRVQRKHIGLFGDIGDQIDNSPISCELSPKRLIRFAVPEFARVSRPCLRLRDRTALDPGSRLPATGSQLARLFRAFGHLSNRRGDAGNRRARFGDFARLALRGAQ